MMTDVWVLSGVRMNIQVISQKDGTVRKDDVGTTGVLWTPVGNTASDGD